MKTLKDPISGHEVTINYIASTSIATMSANGKFIAEEVPAGSRGLAQNLYTRGDLNGFGSFLERPQ